MSYCSVCGAELSNNAKFCVKCGAQVNNAVMPRNAENVYRPVTADPDLINAVRRVVEPITQVTDLATRANACQNSIQTAERKIQTAGYKNPTVHSAILGAVIGLFVFSLFKIHSFIALIIFCAILIGGFYMFFTVNGNKIKAQLEKDQAAYEGYVDQVNSICSTIAPSDIEVIPQSYRYGAAVQFICNALENQRAMNMQEAVNLFEDQVYKNQMYAMQQAQIQQLKGIRTSSGITAAATTANILYKLF